MPLRRRRPVLRAAAVGGGAYVAGKRHAEKAAQEQGYDEPAGAPQATPDDATLSSTTLEQLDQLGQLHDRGVLTDEEFAQQKARLLGQ